MRSIGLLQGSDLVQLINTLSAEGVLDKPEQLNTLYAKNMERGNTSQLIFYQGHLIKAISSDYDIHLGEVLINRNLIEKEQLTQLLEEQKMRQVVLGTILREKELISEEKLVSLIHHLIEIVSYEILLWKKTDFQLDSVPLKNKSLSDIGVHISIEQYREVKEFIQASEKYLPVVVLIKDMFNNPSMLINRLRDPSIEEISDHQQHVNQFINNENTLRDILMMSDLNYFETYSALYQLVSWEIAGVGEVAPQGYSGQSSQAKSKPKPKAKPQSKPATDTASSPKPKAGGSTALRRKIDAQRREASREFLKKTAGSELLHILVAVLSSGKKSGKLIIENQKNDIRSELTLNAGNLVHASSTMYSDRFGDLLVKKGVITPDDLQQALSTQKEDRSKRLGQILVEMELISEETIPLMIYHQIECVLYEVLSWSEAKFYFEASKEKSQTDFVIYADYQMVDGRLVDQGNEDGDGKNLLGDADKNLPVLLLIKEKMSHPSAIVQLTTTEIDIPLSDSQKQTLALVNGINSLNDIVVMSDLDYFQTYANLYQIYSWGVIELLPVQTTNTPPQPPAEEKTKSSVAVTADKRTPADMSSAATPSPPSTPSAPPSSARPPRKAPPRSDGKRPDSSARDIIEKQKREIYLLKNSLKEYQKISDLFGSDLIRKLATVPSYKQETLRKILSALVEFGSA